MPVVIHRILDFFFPRVCPICGGILSLTEDVACLGCLMDLPRTMQISCPEDNELKNIFELQIPVVRAAAFMRYMPKRDSIKIVKKIKYGGGGKLAIMIGRMIAEELLVANPKFFEGIDVIVPLPLTAKRMRERGYNQTEMLAKGVSGVTGIEVDCSSVKRTRFVQSQTSLTREERLENVKGAFKCVCPEQLEGKHVLLMDDVVTTGSSLLALADSIMAETNNVSFSVLALGITGEMKC